MAESLWRFAPGLRVSVSPKAGIQLQGSPRLHDTSGNHGRKADLNPEAMEEMRF